MSDLTYTTRLTMTTCWCGIGLAVPEDLYFEAKRTGMTIHCPLGHTFVFKNSENERLRREVQDLTTRLTHARDRTRQEQQYREAEQRAHAATKGHLTRLRNRVQHGVCTQCHRSFQNLARHMATKHPEAPADETAP